MFKKLNNNLLILFLFQSFALFFLFIPSISQASIADAKKATVMVGNASGVVISSTEVLTAAHVIDEFGSNPQITFPNGKIVTGKVVKYSSLKNGRDLAVVKIPKGNYSTVKIGNYKSLKKGDKFVLFGHPRGQKNIETASGNYSMDIPYGATSMMVSTAQVIGGYSGGPTVNKNGELIGISSMKSGRNPTQYGSAWSSPINKSIIDSLPAGSGPGGPGRPPSGGGGPGGGGPGGGGSGGTKPGSVGDPAERKNIVYEPEVPVGNMGFGDITGTSIAVYIRGLVTYAIGVVGIVAAFIVMWAGFLWIAAGGDQQRISVAKTWLYGALLGLVLTLSAYLILDTINPALVEIKDITPTFKSEGIKEPDEYISGKKEEGGEQGGGGQSGSELPEGSESKPGKEGKDEPGKEGEEKPSKDGKDKSGKSKDDSASGEKLGENAKDDSFTGEEYSILEDKELEECLKKFSYIKCIEVLSENDNEAEANNFLKICKKTKSESQCLMEVGSKGTMSYYPRIKNNIGPSTAMIFAPNTGQGTGMILDKQGYILTAKHVIGDDKEVSVIIQDGTDDGYLTTGNVIGTHKEKDLAILKIASGDYQAVTLGNSSNFVIGEKLFSVGHPGGSRDLVVGGGRSLGIVRGDLFEGFNFKVGTKVLAYTIKQSGGNSGGPIVNEYGEVVGVVKGRHKFINGIIKIGIPINDVKRLIPSLKRGESQ